MTSILLFPVSRSVGRVVPVLFPKWDLKTSSFLQSLVFVLLLAWTEDYVFCGLCQGLCSSILLCYQLLIVPLPGVSSEFWHLRISHFFLVMLLHKFSVFITEWEEVVGSMIYFFSITHFSSYSHNSSITPFNNFPGCDLVDSFVGLSYHQIHGWV